MTGAGWFEGVGRDFWYRPLIGSAGTVIFPCRLGYKAEIGNFKRFIYFYIIFNSAVIIALGIFVFSRAISAPLSRIKEITQSLAKGELSQRVDIKADYDIGGLAESFNIMADRLEERIKALEKLNQELRTARKGDNENFS